MGIIKKELLLGFVIGLIANLVGSYLYIYFFSDRTLKDTLNLALQEGVLGNIIGLGAIFNLAIFFIFLKKNQFYRARGAILATLIAALIVLILKFY